MVLTVAAGFVSSPLLGHAEDVDALSRRGTDLRRQGRDAEALAEFQRALEIQKTPRIQAQVALAEQALGLWSAAEEDLGEALAQTGDPWIKKNATVLKGAFDTIQAHLGTLEVWGTPVGAAVFVNEKPMGSLPLKKPVRVSGDSAVLRVRAEKHLEATRTVRVPAGQTVREYVELVPVVASAVSPKAPELRELRRESREETVASSKDQGATKDQPAEATSTPIGLRPFAWAAATGSVVGLTLGIIETFVAVNNNRAFNDHTVPNPADPAHPTPDCNTDVLSDTCRPWQQAYNRSVRLAIVGYAVGGALAVCSAVLFVLSSRADGSSRSALACVPDIGTPGVACGLTF